MAGGGELTKTPAGAERRRRQRTQAGLGQPHRIKVDSWLWGTLDGDSDRVSPGPSEGCQPGGLSLSSRSLGLIGRS